MKNNKLIPVIFIFAIFAIFAMPGVSLVYGKMNEPPSTSEVMPETIRIRFLDGVNDPREVYIAPGSVPGNLIPANPTRPGHTFAGWEPNPGGAFNTPTDIFARWDTIYVTITFESGPFQPIHPPVVMAPVLVPWGTGVPPLSLPRGLESEGWVHVGWTPDPSGPFIQNTTLTAHWAPSPTFRVTFDLNGGNVNNSTSNIVVEVLQNTVMESRDRPQPIRGNHVFNNWHVESTNTVFDINSRTITSNMTLVAQWTTGHLRTLTFNPSGGAGRVTGNFSRELPQGVTWASHFGTTGPDSFSTWARTGRANFSFQSWLMANGNEFTHNTPMPVENTTINAIWRPLAATNPHTLTFNPQYGNLRNSGNNITMTVAHNMSVQNSNGYISWEQADLIPVGAGFAFDGWEMPDGNLLYINNTNITTNMMLTPRWTATETWTLNFNPNGGFWADPTLQNLTRTVARGQSIMSHHGQTLVDFVPLVIRPGYIFNGWYLNEAAFNEYTVITGNAAINARWMAEVPVTLPAPEFRDIPAGVWYENYVSTVVNAGLFQGTGEGAFSPDMSMTRAMFAQVIFNMSGVPLTFAESQFTDIAPGSWYLNPVQWASNSGIVQGMGGKRFAPATAITREQMAVMIDRYAQYAGTHLPAEEAHFTDLGQISPWALNAVGNVQAAGIITGRPGGNFDPSATATRAEVAAVFARFLEFAE